jgi:hypothetical protein
LTAKLLLALTTTVIFDSELVGRLVKLLLALASIVILGF